MKCHFIVPFLMLLISGKVETQNLSKSLAKILMVEEKVSGGIHYTYLNTDQLFNSKQFIHILRCKPRRKFSLGFEYFTLKPTSEFAKESAATAAINAGFFNMRDGGSVTFLKVDDKVISKNTDASERITKSALAIDERDRLAILAIADTAWLTKPENYDDVLVTGPLLMQEGVLTTVSEQENEIRHPRTCLCTKRNGQVLLVAVDGRSEEAMGMTLYELAQLMQALKCRDAINLDGGGSTTMWIEGKGVVNHPSDNKIFDAGGERKVANVILVH